MTRVLNLCVSIDTEEDNWVPARSDITLANIRALPSLARTLERLGVRPTYFTAYQVIADAAARDIMRDLAADERVEIGAHLHPWNTPPLSETLGGRQTMMHNLPLELQAAKLETLTRSLTDALGRAPASFRAGRWGLGRSGAAVLAAQGYRTDSSATPFISWEGTDGGADHRSAPLRPYWLDPAGLPSQPAPAGNVVELPVSVGYTRRPFALWHEVFERASRLRLARWRLSDVLSRGRVCRKVILSPEAETTTDMVTLARRLVEDGVGFLHAFFHSPSLVPGLSLFSPDAAAVERLCRTLEEFLEQVAGFADVRFATVGEVAEQFRARA